MSGRLEGKVTVITGGASGIGKATVKLFAAEGAKVVFGDVQDGKGEELARELDAIYQHTDVSREDHVAGLIQKAVDTHGRVDCVFNNAGIAGPSSSIADLDMDEYDACMAVDVRSVALGLKHAAKHMIGQKSGSIISTASVASTGGGYSGQVYVGAKAAVVGLTKAVALELGQHNVRVNCICPGGIVTPIIAKGAGLPSQLADQTEEALRPIFNSFQPIPRPGEGSDIAEAALWLASDHSTFVNGHSLFVDGGVTAGRFSPGAPGEGLEFMRAYFEDALKQKANT